jgi:hypothetical protein
MKCPYCDGKGYYYQESSYGTERVQCNCQRVQTNEEYIHSLNTEQLADAIYDLLIGRQWDSWSWKLNGMVLRDIYEHGNTKSTKAIMKWLKQPHTQ